MTGPLVIGLTGGSGSGKGAVAQVLRGFGARVLDADQLSREAVCDPAALSELVARLGPWVVGEDGLFDRKAVGLRVFGGVGADGVGGSVGGGGGSGGVSELGILTGITHKYIIKAIDERVRAYREGRGPELAHAPALVLDAPLPVGRGFLDNVDVVWAVVCDSGKRIERITARDGITPGQARARLAAQMADIEYVRIADVVIRNDGSLADLELKARQAWRGRGRGREAGGDKR